MNNDTSNIRLYDALDLVRAYLDARKYRSSHPDLASYHLSRYRALALAFCVDPDTFGGRVFETTDEARCPTTPESKALAWLFAETVSRYESTATPFDKLLEGPRGLAAFAQAHGQPLSKLADATRERLILLMRDSLVTLAAHIIELRPSSHDLHACGFDDSQNEPDPLDYL